MKNKINLVELLKDCPKGMELDCTMFDNVYLERVDKNLEYPIAIRVGKTDIKRLTKEGCWNKYSNAKCVIFPKGRTSWDGFQRPFIDGDIIVDKQGTIAIYKRVHESYEEPCVDFHCRIYHGNENLFHTNIIKGSLEHCGEIDSARFATEEEKLKLFQAIKDNGYKWNTKTKNLEKLVTIFKIGDKIKLKNEYVKKYNDFNIREVTEIKHSHYILDDEQVMPLSNQYLYELVTNESYPKPLKYFGNMIREEIIKFANDNCIKIAGETDCTRCAAYEGITLGAKWVGEIVIEKACEWLSMNIIDYITEGSRDGISLENQKQLIEDFRKAMKMEE